MKRRLIRTPASAKDAFFYGAAAIGVPVGVKFGFMTPLFVAGKATGLQVFGLWLGLTTVAALAGGVCAVVPVLLYRWAYREVTESSDLWRRPPGWF